MAGSLLLIERLGGNGDDPRVGIGDQVVGEAVTSSADPSGAAA